MTAGDESFSCFTLSRIVFNVASHVCCFVDAALETTATGVLASIPFFHRFVVISSSFESNIKNTKVSSDVAIDAKLRSDN